MALARLVVLEGPDLGTEHPIPMRGGGIGRGEGNIVQLSDPSVSREHCQIEFRSGQLTLVDHLSRKKTLLNGAPISRQALQEGDTISVGKTVLKFHLDDQSDLRPPNPSRVTIEVHSTALVGAFTPQDSERRHLAAVAAFGDSLHSAKDRGDLGRASCQAVVAALGADRGFLLLREKGRMVPTAASVVPDDPAGQLLAVPQDVVGKVTLESKGIAAEGIETSTGPRAVVAAPLLASPNEAPLGLLYADKRAGAWREIDLMALNCLAHLLSAALASLRAREILAAENRTLSEQLGKGPFVGQSEPALALGAFIRKVGPSDATVLIIGQSGSGKEMVAQGIHEASRRSGGSFVAVNCAALTETLIESELFGHEKGSFTGATDRKIGRFEAANRGTLFLDEVGELPLSCQTKFLRVLEEQCFDRVGGVKPIHVDVRVVAATNRDLVAMVKAGTFREDLFYRLSVIQARVPSLRERPGDIPLLAQHFLQRLGGRVARRVDGFDPQAMQVLQGYAWPGNVRELRNAVERGIVLGDGPLIMTNDLPPEVAGSVASIPAQMAPTAPVALQPQMPASLPAQAQPAPRALKAIERDAIIAALESTGGNKAQAAALLEIDRSTLYKKIKDYGIGS